MAKREDVQAFLKTVEDTFMSRHAQYGTQGMTIEKARSLASTKLDRIANGAMTDSVTDLAGYAVIMSLIQDGKWEDMGGVELAVPAKPTGEEILVLRDERAKEYPMPKQSKEGDAGVDLYVVEDTVIPARSEKPVDVASGVRFSLPRGYWGMIINRSSANKRGLLVASNVIDQGFQGALFATCRNTTGEDITLRKGERVAQVVLIPLVPAYCTEVESEAAFPKTERGTSGWGSTGV
jgi:dUTP pyrophosphatase